MASTSPPRSQILDTDRMGQWHADRRRDPGGSPRWNAVRWLLLAAVLAGLVGMHVLTDGDDTSVHGDLAPAPVAAAQSSSGDRVVPAGGRAGGGYAWSGAVVSAAPNDPMGADHAMAQCVLFLVTVGSALLLALLGSRCPTTTRGLFAAVTAIWGELRRRGPPGPERPRIALCVTRT